MPMPKHLQRDLESVKREILEIGAMVEEATNKAITALLDRRTELAEDVMQGDDAVDMKEVRVEEECLKVLALNQPVARDLRFIVAVMKVNNDLERMGDLAVHIAERAAYLSRHPPLNVPQNFARMAEQVRGMVHECLDALVNHDTELARRICRADAEVDDVYRELFKALQEQMEAAPDNVDRAMHHLSACRHMERIADLATNIAEDVLYMVEGEVVRHKVDGRFETRSDPSSENTQGQL